MKGPPLIRACPFLFWIEISIATGYEGMSRLKRLVCWALGGLLGLLLAAFLTIYLTVPVWLPRAIVDAPNAGMIIDPAADPAATRLRELGVTAHHRIEVGPPTASLALYQIDPPPGIVVRGTILVLHGIHDCKESQVGTGRYLAGLGYRAILLDLRGHGRSTGRFLTYGVVESRDCRQVLDWLDERGLLVQPVGAVGFSYGGVVSVHLAAIDPRVAAVVTVSTFASLREVLGDYVVHYMPIVGRMLTREQLGEALSEAGRLANFDPSAADTMRAAQNIMAPLLIIHGGRDDRIPLRHAYEIQNAAIGCSGLLILPDEDHDSIMADRSGAVQSALCRWFSEWGRSASR